MKKYIILILLLLIIPVKIFSQDLASIKLSIVYLHDSNLPSISETDMKKILKEAEKTISIRFGVMNINFINKGTIPIENFFNKYLNTQSKMYKELGPERYELFNDKINYEPFKEKIIKFLSKNKIRYLAEFFPEKKDQLITYEDILHELMKVYLKKLKILEGLKLKNGNLLINRQNNKHNSYINWLLAMNEQDEYDVVISNTFIVYDHITKPYISAVTRYAKVGGSSFISPKREEYEGRSAMLNLFEMLTDIDYFKSVYAGKNITQEIWNKIIGTYILAHEIGHMIYLIPDVSDHDRGCLMDASYDTLDYYEGYKMIVQHPRRCTKCEPYTTSRNYHFYGNTKFKKQAYKGAISDFRMCAKTVPKYLDEIEYKEYKSILYYKIAISYYKLNNKEYARKYIKMALNNNPANKNALILKQKLN